MDIKSSNKLKAQDEALKRKASDLKGLKLAKSQEREKEKTMIKIVEKIQGGVKIKYIAK